MSSDNPTPVNEGAAAKTPASPSALATAEPWDLVAEGYTAEALPFFETFAREAIRRAGVGPGSRIVDVAAGPGTLSLLAAAAGARVSAIDFSAAMVARFRARADASGATGLAGAVDIREGDGQHLPFDSAAYDAAFSMFGLMFFPDRAAGLRELLRVLRPGGRAIIASWVPFDGPFGELLRTTKELIPELPFGGGKPPLGDPADIERELAEAGFSSVTVDVVDHQLTAPSFDAFWDSMLRTNAPLVLLRHRLGPETWDRVGPKIRAKLRDKLDDGPLVIGRGAYFGTGVA